MAACQQLVWLQPMDTHLLRSQLLCVNRHQPLHQLIRCLYKTATSFRPHYAACMKHSTDMHHAADVVCSMHCCGECWTRCESTRLRMPLQQHLNHQWPNMLQLQALLQHLLQETSSLGRARTIELGRAEAAHRRTQGALILQPPHLSSPLAAAPARLRCLPLTKSTQHQ